MGQTSNGMFDGVGTGVAPGAGFDRILRNAGVPGQGTNETQTLTIGATPTGGSFKLSFESQTTTAIAWNANNTTLLASIQAALDALTSLGTNGCVATAGTLTAGVGTITLTFGAARERQAVETIAIANNSLTPAATLTNVEATPGVDAAFRGYPVGTTVVDTTNKILYINTGTATLPVWTKVGVQT
jgi:hypothetical protein